MIENFIMKIIWEYFCSMPLLWLLLLVGCWLTIQTKFIQFRAIAWWLRSKRKIDVKSNKGDLSPFQALMTSLAGAIGTGNIAGIATAITVGGYGALFWMWVVAFLGMATSFSETVLALKYRVINEDGEILGGPMITLERGLNSKFLGSVFAICCVLSSLGYNMVQANSVVSALSYHASGINNYILALIISLLCSWILFGGIQRIGKVASSLVPMMMVIYLVMCVVIVIKHYQELPQALLKIIYSAFNGHAAIGGFSGATVAMALQAGAKYGVFANEAGIGSCAIANASAKVANPVPQGNYAMLGVFLSTMILCTLTGLVVILTDVFGTVGSNNVLISGSELALLSFSSEVSWFAPFVTVSLILFALTTVIGWSYYGTKGIEYVLGIRYIKFYKFIVILVLFYGSVANLSFVWSFAHFANSLMFIPNLISVVFLAKHVKNIINDYVNGDN